MLTLFCRAYIAASRRSDRSLEARLESARRASEIHKRRTGKALRVTEADVLNEEMYEEEDDLPTSLPYGLGSSPFELRMRMQAYWEQQFALRNAMSVAAAGGNLNAVSQPPLSLRDYYQRFAQQYPLSLTTNQYVFPAQQLPLSIQQNPPLVPSNIVPSNVVPSNVLSPVSPVSPSVSSTHSNSPTKSPIVGANNHRSPLSTAPYSANNSQRNKRASVNIQITEQCTPQQKIPTSVPTQHGALDFTKTPLTNDLFTAQPYQSPVSPFTTQLPAHMQQYYLPDFVDTTITSIPVQSVPLDKVSAGDTTDIFSNDWTNFLGSHSQAPTKTACFEEGTNWDEYLDGDANWLFATSQPEQEQKS